MNTVITISLVLGGLFAAFQIYTTMATEKTETQPYKVIRIEKEFEIRYYPEATLAKINSTAKSYRNLGNSGFGTLAKYIFGGNEEKKQIGMTSPVHMEIGDSISTMAFVMPATMRKENLPGPLSGNILLETTAPEYVAAIRFGGFSNNESIEAHKKLLETALKAHGLNYSSNFRYLGYNPPYQVIGRRNEVIVHLNASNFDKALLENVQSKD